MQHKNQNDRRFTVSIFRNGNNRAIRIPRAIDPEGVDEMEVTKEGDVIILRPVRPTWNSFWNRPGIDKIDDFLSERPDMIEAGRFELAEEDLEDGK